MTYLKLVIPKQDNPDDRWLSVEDEVVVITAIVSFYKIGNISRWALNSHGIQFATIGANFSTLRLRKDNSSLDLTLELGFETEATGKVERNLKVESMEFVSELPHDVRMKLI